MISFVGPFLTCHCCLALRALWQLVDVPFYQQYTGVGEMLLEIYYVILFSQLVSALFLVELFEPLLNDHSIHSVWGTCSILGFF